MARFFTVASGSSGNCAYVGGGDAGVLVDAGISCKGIVAAVEGTGTPLSHVQAIFITHEHIDHIRGLRVLLKKCKVPVYASSEVLRFLLQNACVAPDADLRAISQGDAPVFAAGMEITCFPTSHDSVHSLGYRIHTADDRLVGVATDLGYVSTEVKEALTGCDLVLLESNYEPSMLMNGSYPYYLKRRIAGEQGHLANSDCAALLPQLVRTGTTRMVLAHLSRENNSPELAHRTSLSALQQAGMTDRLDFLLHVAPRSEPEKLTLL